FFVLTQGQLPNAGEHPLGRLALPPEAAVVVPRVLAPACLGLGERLVFGLRPDEDDIFPYGEPRLALALEAHEQGQMGGIPGHRRPLRFLRLRPARYFCAFTIFFRFSLSPARFAAVSMDRRMSQISLPERAASRSASSVISFRPCSWDLVMRQASWLSIVVIRK